MASDKNGPEGLRKLVTGLDINGGAAFMAGLIAGIVFLVIELVTGYAMGFDTPLGPADVVLRALTDGSVSGAGADFGIIFIASIFHLFVSILLAFILAFIVYRWSTGVAIMVGLVYGLIIYVVAFVLFALVFSEMLSGRGIIMLGNHLLFGALTAWLYKRFEAMEVTSSSSGSTSSGASSSTSSSSSQSSSKSSDSDSSSAGSQGAPNIIT